MSDSLPTLIAELQRLTTGLLWMSETDEPFAVFHWPQQTLADLTEHHLLQLTNHPLDTPIETVDLDAFFAPAILEQAWFGVAERATAKRYRELVALLKQHLAHLKVYRLGRVTIDIYVVGQIGTAVVVGLATKAVET